MKRRKYGYLTLLAIVFLLAMPMSAASQRFEGRNIQAGINQQKAKMDFVYAMTAIINEQAPAYCQRVSMLEVSVLLSGRLSIFMDTEPIHGCVPKGNDDEEEN